MRASSDEHDRWMTGAGQAVLWSVAILVATGCSRHRTTESPEPVREAAPHAAPSREPVRPAPAAPVNAAPTFVPRAPAATITEPTPQRAPSLPEPEPERLQEKPRDFRAELERMLGDVGSCVKPRGRDHATMINIAVTAHVMPGGAVPHGEVSASELQREELACIKQRLESLRFAAPIENAPFTVEGSLNVQPSVSAVEHEVAQRDALGMSVTQAPSGEGISPGIVPAADPGVVPPPDPGIVPARDPPASAIPEMPVPPAPP
jgi:hypothetical protein